MPDNPAIPNSSNFEQLKTKLRQLFELDKADLDFGIYRILRVRHKEITEFLDQLLARTVYEALQSHGTLQQAQAEQELHEAEQQARALGMNPDDAPRVKELRAKFAAGADINATANEVYSHLLTFFSRYYSEGDFIGLQRSTVQGREKYMIPYNGEEVKLVWANMDQYYIKSSELLRDYSFHLTKADIAPEQLDLGLIPDEVTVHFKLVEGDTEKDNVKPEGKTIRAFALDADEPIRVIDDKTLEIHFRYREHPSERNLQDKLNAAAENTLAEKLPERWKSILFANDRTYKGKDKKDMRTLLQKHLRGYTAKFQFDYFIHKDLGGFLRRELDFYIKNEVMHLDDIEETTAPKAEEYLSKVRAIRCCALPIIRMLAQLEDFQKKLWLKKKFVVETRYCMTLDRVPEELYPEICANEAQWAEWEQLYAISEIPRDLITAEPRTPEFLKQQSFMMLDTRHFPNEFKHKLLMLAGDIDESLDGVCFHSENFQALRLIQERYREQVKCVYTDPPYNTSENSFVYKNLYKHSSWIAMMVDRLLTSRELNTEDGTHSVAIDDTESGNLKNILNIVFGADNYLSTISVEVNPAGQNIRPNVPARSHDYCHIYARDGEQAQLQLRELTEEEIALYKLTDKDGKYLWDNLRRRGGNSRPEDRPGQWFPLYGSLTQNRVSLTPFEGSQEFWPIDPKGERRIWRVNPAGAERGIKKGDISIIEKAGRVEIVKKTRIPKGKKPKTHWNDSRYSATTHGTKLLIDILGANKFSYPKSLYLVQDCIQYWCDSSGLVLDFFAGSGTTGHAVINLDRDDDESERKYILVEVGEYFDSVLVSRLKKVVYSTDWQAGRPQNRNTGISHAFKIVRLESYEDTLNNLRLARTPEQEVALRDANEQQRNEYMLGYFLDVESAGSASLLDVSQFRDPFNYQLQIATSSVGQTRPTSVDLIETFNWLIGLKVKHIDAQKGFVRVTGEKRAGGRTLVIWRTLGDDPVADNQALEQYLAKLEINPADTEYDLIFVNGSHTLNDPHNKVHLIEEEFQRRMFENGTAEGLD